MQECIENLLAVKAFSVNERIEQKADELQENNFVNVCIDLAMRGLGSKSCGPDLAEEYEIPREFSNKFYFKF